MTEESSSETPADFPSASSVITAFGGIRPMAARLAVPVSTVQGWKQRDAIPPNRFDEIRAAAIADGIVLDIPSARGGGDEAQTASTAPSASIASSATMTAQAGTHAPVEPGGESAAAPPTTPAPSGQRGAGGAMIVALLALVLAVGVAGWTWWTQQQVSQADTGDRLARMESEMRGQISAIRDAVAKVAGSADRPAATPAQIAALGERLDTLAGKLDAIDVASPDRAGIDALARDIADITTAVTDVRTAVSANSAAMSSLRSGIDTTMTDLSGRLVSVENREGTAAAMEARAVGLAIAAAEIRRTLRSGAPFAGGLETLRELAASDAALAPAIATLAVSADTGLPTTAALARRFDGLIGAILAADRSREGAVWYRQALDRVSEIVTVRRVGGDAGGNSADAVVARIEARLADDDLAGAVAQAASLKGQATAAITPWLAASRDVLAAEAAVATINTKALAALAGARGN